MNDEDAFLLLRRMLDYAKVLVDQYPSISRDELARRLAERFAEPYMSTSPASKEGRNR